MLKLGLLSPDKPMWLHHLAQFHGSNSYVIGSVVISNRLYSQSKMNAIRAAMFRVVKQVLGWQSI